MYHACHTYFAAENIAWDTWNFSTKTWIRPMIENLYFQGYSWTQSHARATTRISRTQTNQGNL